MKKIISWNIKVFFNDGTTEEIADVPNSVAQPVDDFLTELEVEEDDF